MRIFCLFELRPDRFHALDFLFQLGNLAVQPGNLDFGRGGLTVSGFKLGQIAFDARLKLFQPLGHLGLREIPVPRVHRLEFAAVDGNRGGGEQAHAPAHRHELAANLADGLAVVLAEIGDSLEVWS